MFGSSNPFFKSGQMAPMVAPASGPGCGGCAQNQINTQVQQMNAMAEQQRQNFSGPGAGGFNKLFE
jgi:hypothetical protein